MILEGGHRRRGTIVFSACVVWGRAVVAAAARRYSGWSGTQVSVDFLFGHGMIRPATYKAVNEACDGHWGTYEPPPEPCRSLLGDPTRPLMREAGDDTTRHGRRR